MIGALFLLSLSQEHPCRTKRAQHRPWTTLNASSPSSSPSTFPLLRVTRLSPSYPRESIVRSRGAPWLGLGTARGWLPRRRGRYRGLRRHPNDAGECRSAERQAGFGDRRTLTRRGCARSFPTFPSRPPCAVPWFIQVYVIFRVCGDICLGFPFFLLCYLPKYIIRNVSSRFLSFHLYSFAHLLYDPLLILCLLFAPIYYVCFVQAYLLRGDILRHN